MTTDNAPARPTRSARRALNSPRTTEDLLEALRDVVDPELGINVVDLGLVYGVTGRRTGSPPST